MRFKARLMDIQAITDFKAITNSISKCSKDCIVRLTPESLFFILSDDTGGPRQPLIFCEIPGTAEQYFRQYYVEGQSEEHNEIYFEICTNLLAQITSTIKKKTAKNVTLRLTNKTFHALTMEVDVMSENTEMHKCTHEIPIDFIPRKMWSDYQQPTFNDFHITLEMPHLRTVLNIVDHMKHFSQALIMSANKEGRLTLTVNTNAADISAHFPDLYVESFAEGTIQRFDSTLEPGEEATATIDIKKFSRFIAGMQVTHSRTSCSIINNKMVKLTLVQPGAMYMQIFLLGFEL